MNFESFLEDKEPDYKDRFLHDIWHFFDIEIEQTHDFIQLLFPLNEQSESVFHGHYLDTESSIMNIKSNELAKENIVKSSKWFLAFLERNHHWRRRYNHNHRRITRIIKSLRLLVSDDDADAFYQLILNTLSEEDKLKINSETLEFWKSA